MRCALPLNPGSLRKISLIDFMVNAMLDIVCFVDGSKIPKGLNSYRKLLTCIYATPTGSYHHHKHNFYNHFTLSGSLLLTNSFYAALYNWFSNSLMTFLCSSLLPSAFMISVTKPNSLMSGTVRI